MDSLHFNGLPIVESQLALDTTTTPVLVHSRRKGSAAYHSRIQKKWIKRFGFVKTPCIFKMNPQVAGLVGRECLLVHPSLMPLVREAIQRSKGA